MEEDSKKEEKLYSNELQNLTNRNTTSNKKANINHHFFDEDLEDEEQSYTSLGQNTDISYSPRLSKFQMRPEDTNKILKRISLGMLLTLIVWCSLNYLNFKYKKHATKGFYEPFGYNLVRV